MYCSGIKNYRSNTPYLIFARFIKPAITKNTSKYVCSANTCFKDSHEEVIQRRRVTLENRRYVANAKSTIDLKTLVSQTGDVLKTVKMSDLKQAPLPSFWYGMGGLIPIVVPTVSTLLFGSSPFLSNAQLYYGATVCSFLGGVRWGHSLHENSPLKPTWENLGYAVVPQLVAWLGMIFPTTLGFILVSGGLSAGAYWDITSGNYPPWFKSLRIALTVPAVLCLLLSALFGLFR